MKTYHLFVLAYVPTHVLSQRVHLCEDETIPSNFFTGKLLCLLSDLGVILPNKITDLSR